MSSPAFLPAAGYVSDGGLETDLIFNHGVDLPEFASFPLVEDDAGRDQLRGGHPRPSAGSPHVR